MFYLFMSCCVILFFVFLLSFFLFPCFYLSCLFIILSYFFIVFIVVLLLLFIVIIIIFFVSLFVFLFQAQFGPTSPRIGPGKPGLSYLQLACPALAQAPASPAGPFFVWCALGSLGHFPSSAWSTPACHLLASVPSIWPNESRPSISV